MSEQTREVKMTDTRGGYKVLLAGCTEKVKELEARNKELEGMLGQVKANFEYFFFVEPHLHPEQTRRCMRHNIKLIEAALVKG